LRLGSLFALAVALAKELSGESQLEHDRQAAQLCVYHHDEQKDAVVTAGSGTEKRIYVEMTEKRFNGVTRCC
jgi:hypothetical protein